MKNWKDKVLGIFAGIGIMSLLMGSYAQQPKGVWEFHMDSSNEKIQAFSLNTQTGEVRKHDAFYNNVKGGYFASYVVASNTQ